MTKTHAFLASLILSTSTACLSDEELATTDVETSEVESAATIYAWSDDQQISGQASAYQVGLATLGSRVHMLYTSSYGYLYHARFDGWFWSGASQINVVARADYGPALVNHGNQLVMVYHSR